MYLEQREQAANEIQAASPIHKVQAIINFFAYKESEHAVIYYKIHHNVLTAIIKCGANVSVIF